MKKILLLLIPVFAFSFGDAQTYTTVQDGNWSNPDTWGGSVPPTTINPAQTVNINHEVLYDQANDLNIDGGRLIITGDTLRFPNNGGTGTGRSIFVKNNGINIGLLSVTNGGLIMPVFLANGITNNSGNIKAENGRIVFLNSYAEMGQNWEATSGSQRKYINSCLKLGENYSNINSTDTLQGVCILIGLHGSANFQNDGGTIRFNTTAILLRGGSGNFTNSSNPSSQILTFGSPSVAILALDVPGNLENNGTWDAVIGEWCVNVQGPGNISGSQSAQIDFLGPENCDLVNSFQCDCEPLGAPLPVTLRSFTAERDRMNVDLVWESVSEVNNRGFNIQRKIGSGNWENLGFVGSNIQTGNSNSLVRYEFSDYNPTRGMTQYRLNQVDIDGRSSYSNIRAVR